MNDDELRGLGRRQNSDLLLSYYESSIPNQVAHFPTPVSAYHHRRSASQDSSSSEYSADQSLPEPSPIATKRLATPSKGGADRRRLAIVQLDSSSPDRTLPHSSASDMTITGSIRDRRGYKNDLSGLALIAPPDAATHTYSRLSPPSTAPLTGDMISRGLKSAVHDKDKAHHRSASDIAQSVSSRWKTDISRSKKDSKRPPPILSFQSPTPKSPEQPLSSGSLSRYLTLNTANFGAPIITPEIGEAKEIHVPVAAPVVVNLANVAQPRTPLSTSRAESPASSTVCGHGMISQTPIDDHKTSHPRPTRLQSPASPPPRMNVDSEPGQARQTRAAALRSAEGKAGNDIGVHAQTNVFTHKREAATATKELDNPTFSSIPRTPQKPLPTPELTLEPITLHRPDGSLEPLSPQYRVLPPTPVANPAPSEPTQKTKDASPPQIDHTKFDHWLKENPQFSARDLRRGASLSLDEPSRQYGVTRPRSPLSPDALNTEQQPPEPPLKGLRHSLTAKVRRFSSLSRATSRSSKSTNRSSQEESRRPSRTPSPLPNNNNYPTRRTPSLSSQNKIISMNPAALFCHEIGGQTTPIQRCYIYANKINELSMYDCGLSNWVTQMKEQSIPQRRRGPSSTLVVPQPRHTSRSSVMSEATFPRRMDATTATDLSPGQFDTLPSPGLPQLPYPSLALRSVPARSNNSSSSISPPTSLRSLTPSFSTTGFFAALGRKASISKKDRGGGPVLSTRISAPGVSPGGARLPPQPVQLISQPRPIQIISPPTIPGGPRARPKRSQTYMSPASAPSAAAAIERDELLARPPSLNDSLTLDNVIDIKPDPGFTKQVDKLAALIPQADRNILAGYLRRAGSDMLAIGQYLEDERMGVVRFH